MIAACWVIQGVLFWTRPPFVGHFTSMVMDGALLTAVACLPVRGPRVRWWWTICLAIATQMTVHVAYRCGVMPWPAYQPIINALYVVQLGALCMPGLRTRWR